MALACWRLLVAVASLCGAAASRQRHQIMGLSGSEKAKAEVDWVQGVHGVTNTWRNRLDAVDRGAETAEAVPMMAHEKKRQAGELQNQLGTVMYQSDFLKEGRETADYGMKKKGQFEDLEKVFGQQVSKSDFVTGGRQQGGSERGGNGQNGREATATAASRRTAPPREVTSRPQTAQRVNTRRHLNHYWQRGWQRQRQHNQQSQKNQQTQQNQQIHLPQQEPSGKEGIAWAKQINEQRAQNR